MSKYPQLQKYFMQLAQVSENDFEYFVDLIEERRYLKGDFFCEPEQKDDLVGFVISGIFRVYYLNQEGEVFIRNFCMEGSPIGSYATILTSDPSHVCIEALENSSVVTINYSNFSSLFEKKGCWERLGRKIAELHYISRERREYQLLTMNATKRYEAFLKDFPGLEARITQSNMASYIGVNPVTLSRIITRSKK